MLRCLVVISLALVAGLADAAEPSPFSAQSIEHFEKQVRPLLIEHCFGCHGPKKQESGLRLDSRAGVLKGGDSGLVFDPQRPAASRLIEAVRRTGDLKMPPDTPLKPEHVAAIQVWVTGGLAWPAVNAPEANAIAAKSHWSFQPIRDVPAPAIKNEKWPQTAIDRFVLAKLEAAGLPPSARVERRTLLRRASLDLLGLPPTAEEVDAFLADPASDRDAFRSQIDKLLQSPHYGERWGRYWLDLARYADTKGYVFFEDKDFPWAYSYRDYVVRALNEDLPFDRFVLEQLAADQLELGDDKRPLAAMGFLTLGNRFMGNVHDQLDDRIDVVTRGLLGLTVSCARCHAHKYDPIPHEDYYSLYGVFRSSVEPTLPPTYLPTPDSDDYRKFDVEMQARVGKLSEFIDNTRNEIIRSTRKRASEYLLAAHAKRGQPSTEDFMLIADKGAIIPAVIHRWEVYLKQTKQQRDPVWSLWHRLFEIPDAEFAATAPGVLAEFRIGSAGASPSRITINPLVLAAFKDAPPQSMTDVAERYGRLLNTIDEQWQTQLKAMPESQRLDDEPAEQVRQAIYGPQSPAMIPRVFGWGFLDLLPDRPSQDVYKKLLGEVEAWSKTGAGAPPRAHVLVDADQAYDPVVFLRGNPNRPSKPVDRAFLSVITGPDRKPFARGSGRLELARAIVSPSNPLTARVLVNRVWQQHFGEGLVRTPSDFGLRGDPPTHPELLDHLATTFVRDGWSLKSLHRQIMNSEVYQQRSVPEPATTATAALVDPENRLLSKFPRRRLDFEATRDSLVAVTGQLNRTIGGPPVQLLSGFNPRRTLYGTIERLDLPTLLRNFDFPDPAASSAQRSATTIAPQALFFLNDDFVSDVARRVLARPDVSSASDPAAKIERLYRACLSRSPTPGELRLATEFVTSRDPVSDSKTVAAWRYGFGKVDDAAQRTATFTELKHWTGTRWQASASLPDPQVGWAFFDAKGGHPAEHADRCVIRRWTSPLTGKLGIRGELKHVPPEGNGVRARIISSRSGQLGDWKVHKSTATTGPFEIAVQTGDTLDFVVDFAGEITHDEHEWLIAIRPLDGPDASLVWNSQADFRGSGSVDRWSSLAQALLMTNEFVFVD